MIKNIVFDIGNIILEGKPKNALKYIDLLDKDKKVIEEIVFDNFKWINLDLGVDDFDSYFEKIKYDIPERIRDIAKDILINSHKYRKFNENVINLIKKLSNNYKIYILSDNNFDTYNYLKTTELVNYINGWCISSNYGLLKRDIKLFEILFDENKLNPSECYFIDDNFNNVEIGKKFGMKGFVLDWENNKFIALIDDMKEKGINI